MSDDLSQALSLETEPEPQPAPPAEPQVDDDDAEPEGVVQVGNQRVVDVSIVAAERKRVRAAAEKRVRDTELAPLQQKAQEVDTLRQAIAAMQPYVDLVKQNQSLIQQQPTNPEDSITDAEAEQEARELQLYGADSQLDLKTAKRVIAKRRQEAYQISQQAVAEAVGPMQQQSAQQASRNNFLAMAGQVDSVGQPLVDPKILAEEWVKIPAELTQNPEVAEVVLERAIGRTMRQGRGRQAQQAPRQPVYSEGPGGRPQQGATVLSALDRKLGISEKDLKDSAKSYVPGGISVIGD